MNKLNLLLPGIIISLLWSCHPTENTTLDLKQVTEEVALFGEGLISTGLYERDLAISPDGKELIFSLGNYKQSLRSLVILKKSESGWGEKNILPFSGRYNDIEPFFSVGGKQLYFASDRPPYEGSERNDYNIWVCQKTNAEWKYPTLLDTIINTKGNEYFPSVAKNGNLYFTATRENGIGREDIFMSVFSDGAYQTPVALDTNVNSVLFEFNAFVHPNEDYIIFSSFGRQDGLGGGDLYISQKDNLCNWTPAKNLGEPINSSTLDYCPFVDLSNNNFYFTSERSNPITERIETIQDFSTFSNQVLNGLGNIYRVTVKGLTQ